MEILELIKKVEEKGIQLWLEGEKLKFRAPESAMTDEIRNQLKENKQEIINLLQERKSPVHDEDGRYESFELTDIQSSYLYGSTDAYGLGDTGCQVYAILKTPVLDEAKLSKALNTIVRRHDMLHTDILPEGKQCVKREVPDTKIRVVDASDISDEERNRIYIEERERGLSRRFKAGQWPFFEITLIHCGDYDNIAIAIDMLIADFASLRIFVSELEAVYFDEELADLELTFRDYIQWKKKGTSEKKIREAEKYWLDRIDNLPEAPELPVTEEKGVSEFRQNSWMIPEEMWANILGYSKKYGITPSNLLLTAYSEIIGLWSGQQRFTLNLTMADRPDVHKDMQRVIGDFTIVDLLEIDNNGRIPYIDKARNIQNKLFRDLEYKEYTGVQVMRSINRQNSKTRLFPVVYTSTIGASTTDESDRFKLVEKITKTPQVYIDCQVATVGETVLISWDVRDGLFPEGMIDEMFATFKDRIKSLADGKLEDEYIAPQISEKSVSVRRDINETKAPISGKLMYDAILDRINDMPEKTAVICGGEDASFEKLGRMAYSVATELINKGIKPGDTVAVNIRKSVWQIAAVLGIQLAGAAYLPLGYDQPEERKNTIINKAGSALCVTDNADLQIDCEKINVEQLDAAVDGSFIPVKVADTDKAYIIYTSGSTGTPKGVVISHRAAVNTIEDINERFNVTKDDRALGVANLAFDLSVYDIFGILGAGGTLVLPTEEEMKDSVAWEELIRKYGVTIWNSVPAQMQMLILYIKSIDKRDYKLRLVMMSGDWIPVTLPREIHDIFENADIISLGGATEAAIWSIYYEIDPNKEYERSIPYGKPLRNQYFRVVNDNLDDCPDMVTGELVIGGIGLADGYHNDIIQTEESFVFDEKSGERLYKTGDIGRYLYDGIIEFQGRKDTQVKINGHRVELSEIESIIQKQPGVEAAAVVTRNNSIVAFIQPEEKSGDLINQDTKLAEIVRDTGSEETGKVDKELFDKWSEYADKTAVYDILNTLRNRNVFDEDRGYSIEEINERMHVHKAFKGLLLRWLGALIEEGIISKSHDDGTYILLKRDIDEGEADIYWEKWNEAEAKLNYSSQMMKYFGDMRRSLQVIMDGSLDPLDVYFPKGDPVNAIAAYHDNIISMIMNNVMVKAVKHMVEAKKVNTNDKFRILEIGAGMGGATREIIPAIAGYDVEYYFTDISQFYLKEAQNTFKEYGFVKYLLANMNKPLESQGIEKGSMDLIIFSQAIHNADSIRSVLSNMKKTLTTDGKILIVDTTGEHKSLLTSVSFNAGIGENMVSVSEYMDMFKEEGFIPDVVFPEEGSSIDSAEQHLFIGTCVKKRTDINEEAVLKAISDSLPEYMIPSKICVLEELPLTSNKKVDRNRLLDSLEDNRNPFVSSSGEKPKDELEEQLEKIWAGALNREYMYRNENFYQAGGDSLLIAQVVAEMKEKIPQAADIEWDELMRTIIETPTIMEVAEKLKSSDNENMRKNKDDRISVFAEGKDKSLVKVLFHDGTGTIYPYQNLIPYILEYNPECAVIGISNTNIDEYTKESSENTIIRLGECYGRLLSEMGYESYELIGFCFGGLLAVEAAKYLVEEGKTVLPVKTIDTPNCDHRIKSDILMERIYAMALGGNPDELGYPSAGEIQYKIDELGKENDVTDDILFESIGSRLDKDIDHRLQNIYQCIKNNKGFRMTEQEFADNYRINKICFESMGEYNELYMGDVYDLYCTEDIDKFYPMLQGNGGDFWKDKVLGRLEEIHIEGNHNSCMQEPIVGKVAELISCEDFDKKGDM